MENNNDAALKLAVDRLVDVTAQRDALAEALEELANVFEGYRSVNDAPVTQAENKARAALAKAGG